MLIATAISLYLDHCHRQPIWCFNLEELGDLSSHSEELLCSVLALTMRFSDERDQEYDYAENARGLVMLRIANGTVELATIESLCLLSYSSFVGMNVVSCLL